MAASKAEIKKQIEYYLSDSNLSRDKFFSDHIRGNADGWLDLQHILNSNKIKQMKVTGEAIVDAVEGSTQVETDESGLKIRRKDNKPLPELTASSKKRDQKAAEKEGGAGVSEETKGEDALPALDERGNPVLVNLDFENPVIIHFKTPTTDDKDFKVNWKDVETAVRKQFPRLKIVYSRADQFQGDLALSSHRINNGELEKLNSTTLTIQNREFTFEKTAGDDLKSFWQKQGGHYQFCIQPKIRNIKKQQRLARQQRERGGDAATEGGKRTRSSYEIAGVYYADINKVKSKARAILNLKKDGEQLTGNDQDFIKELLQMHDKADQKLAGFAHFEVGEHPDFAKTRCFFVVSSDGKKQDFSISKCINKLEQQ